MPFGGSGPGLDVQSVGRRGMRERKIAERIKCFGEKKGGIIIVDAIGWRFDEFRLVGGRYQNFQVGSRGRMCARDDSALTKLCK